MRKNPLPRFPFSRTIKLMSLHPTSDLRRKAGSMLDEIEAVVQNDLPARYELYEDQPIPTFIEERLSLLQDYVGVDFIKRYPDLALEFVLKTAPFPPTEVHAEAARIKADARHSGTLLKDRHATHL
jgi:hypothetical protein